MKNNRSYILLILVASIVFASAFKSNQHSSTHEEKWISLFNGKDLKIWGDKLWKCSKYRIRHFDHRIELEIKNIISPMGN